jgi:hypothetical protein
MDHSFYCRITVYGWLCFLICREYLFQLFCNGYDCLSLYSLARNDLSICHCLYSKMSTITSRRFFPSCPLLQLDRTRSRSKFVPGGESGIKLNPILSRSIVGDGHATPLFYSERSLHARASASDYTRPSFSRSHSIRHSVHLS